MMIVNIVVFFVLLSTCWQLILVDVASLPNVSTINPSAFVVPNVHYDNDLFDVGHERRQDKELVADIDDRHRQIQKVKKPDVSWANGRLNNGNIFDIEWDPSPPKQIDAQKDLVQPEEIHLEGVPFFIKHPKPLYYTMKGHPATIECIAEPVSHAAIKCADQLIPYKGPEESGQLQIIRLDAQNQPDLNGQKWILRMQVRSKDVEEWFDSYICQCEVWNKVVQLKRPKKVLSKTAVIKEAYLERKFQLEPVSTDLAVGKRLVLMCIPPKGKPDPDVYWLKNNQRIEPHLYPHIVFNNYNNLIIENTTIADSGNYTCVASCLNVEFRYSNARVNIYPNIVPPNHPMTDQNSWNEWSDCYKTEPKELGKTVVFECEQMRYRLCAFRLLSKQQHSIIQPSTFNELDQTTFGNCLRPWYQTRNCSKNICLAIWDNGANQNHVARSYLKTKEMYIYVGLFLTLALVLSTIAILTILSRRKSFKLSTSRALHYSFCIQGKQKCHKDKINRKTKDMLLSNELSQTMITISNPSANESQFNDQTNKMVYFYNTSTTRPMNGSITNHNLSSIPSLYPNNHQQLVTYDQVHNMPPITPNQNLIFSNGATIGSNGTVLKNLLGPIQSPLTSSQSWLLPSINVLPPLPNSPTLNVASLSNCLDTAGGYEGLSNASNSHHLTNNLSINLTGSNHSGPYAQSNIAHGDYIQNLSLKSPLNEMPNLEFGKMFNNELLTSVPNGVEENSSGPSPANTATNTTAIDSINGGSNGSGSTSFQHPSTCLSSQQLSNGISKSEHNNTNHHHQQQQQLQSRPLSALYHELALDQESQLSHDRDLDELTTIVHGNLSYSGGQLGLTDSGVFLTIPQGALEPNTINDVYLAVCREDKYRPILKNHQTLLSPIIQFGPRSCIFHKPVLVSFPHCAGPNLGNWSMRLLGLDTIQLKNDVFSIDSSPSVWQEVATIGYDSSSPNLTCHVESNMIHVVTNVGQRFCVVGESQRSIQSLADTCEPAVKKLKLAAFARPIAKTTSVDFNMRIYVLADTKDALEYVASFERQLDSKLLDKPKSILFKDNAMGLCFSIENISIGWRSRLQSKYQEIPFRHVWNGSQNATLHCAFALEHVDPHQFVLNCNVVVHQDNCPDQKQTLHISSNKMERSISKTCLPSNDLICNQLSNQMNSNCEYDPYNLQNKIHLNMIQNICTILDSSDDDFQKLLSCLGLEKYAQFFYYQLNRTNMILNLWKAQQRDPLQLNDLKHLLFQMNRLDCISLIDSNLA